MSTDGMEFSIDANNSSISESTASTGNILRNTFLVICMVGGCAANLYLLIVVCASRTMRRRSVYKLLLNAAIANLIDVLLNLSIVLGYSIRGSWPYDRIMCQVNAFFINWLDDVHLLNLLLLAIERSVAIHMPRTHRKRFREGTCFVIITLTWLASFATNVPIATNTIPPLKLEMRYSCALTTEVTIIYTFITLFACFLVPFCATVGMYIDIWRVAWREGEKESNNADGGATLPTVWRELNMSKLTASTSFAWIILVGPYTVLVYIDTIKNSSEFKKFLNPDSSNDERVIDTILFWMRHYYTLCLPLLCVVWRRDVRRKTRYLVCAAHHPRRQPQRRESPLSATNHLNTLNSISSPRRTNPNVKSGVHANGGSSGVGGKDVNDDDDELDSVNSMDYDEDEDVSPETLRPPPPPNIPVLFATSEGLHVQTDSSPYNSRGLDSVVTARVIKCDVTNSSADLRGRDYDNNADRNDVFGSSETVMGREVVEADGDDGTSDYASNRDSDAFQLSNPISVRSAASHGSAGGGGSHGRRRSTPQQPRRHTRRQESIPGEVRVEGEMSQVTTTERYIDAGNGQPAGSGSGANSGAGANLARPPSGSGEGRRKKRSKVERTERQEVGADLEAARATANALYSAGNAPNPGETKERKPRRRRHKRNASSSDVAPAPVYSAQVSKDSITTAPPNLSGSNGSAQAPEIRRARRRERSRGEDSLAAESNNLLKPPRRLEPLEVNSARNSDKDEIHPNRLGLPEEKPKKKKRRKKKSSTDPAPIEMEGWNPT